MAVACASGRSALGKEKTGNGPAEKDVHTGGREGWERHPRVPWPGYGGAESAGRNRTGKKEGRGGWPLPTR